MSDPGPPATLRCRGAPGARRRLYAALGASLAAHRGSAAVVFESESERPEPRVLLRPASLAMPLFADPAVSGAVEVDWAGPAPLEPPRDHADLAVSLRTSPLRPEPAPPFRGALSPTPLVGPHGWLGVQTLWLRGEGGRIWAARRAWFSAPSERELAARREGVGAALAQTWSVAVGVPSTAEPLRRGAARRDWRSGGARSLPCDAWVSVAPARLERTAEPVWASARPYEPAVDGHALVLGASGAGKSWLLADRAARAIGRGEPVFAIDLHGDLAPAILARLSPPETRSVVAIDLADPPFPGIAALDPQAPPDRAAAHLVAALKRLSADGAELHWGFRLERILDSFVRLVQEESGSLTDLYALLTDRDRREAARLRTRRPELARFLEELGPIVSRSPDFLWPAAARLSKVALLPELARLLAPGDGGIPVEPLLAGGRSILLRLPFARLGPEAAQFAGTVALARVYLSLAARGTAPGRPGVLVVLDEVHGFAPRLVAEMIAEGRKFGLRLLVATQYPDRLAPDLKAAAAGAIRDLVAFRVPPASAAQVGSWLGLAREELAERLTELPPGYGWARDPEAIDLRALAPEPWPRSFAPEAWGRATEATRSEFPPDPRAEVAEEGTDGADERILLATLGAEERGERLGADRLPAAAAGLAGASPADGADLARAALRLERQGCLDTGSGAVHLTEVGERRLGLGRPTGAASETAEHRALLIGAFRLLARRGYRLEIVRQGRWDTTLPDGRLAQLPPTARSAPPEQLSRAIDAARRGWAWRFFGGRDVHVEAEVSGALRPARIRHGVRKAERAGAFPLFLVADAARARRVRSTLRGLGLGPREAQVWTLRSALSARAPRTDGP
jgi:hypothetical protein